MDAPELVSLSESQKLRNEAAEDGEEVLALRVRSSQSFSRGVMQVISEAFCRTNPRAYPEWITFDDGVWNVFGRVPQ